MELKLEQARSSVRTYLEFKILSFLAPWSPPLPSGVTTKLRISANKRNPKASFVSSSSEFHGGSETAHLKAFEELGTVAHDPSLKNILIVIDEATTNDSSIFALNLVRHLSHRYNITTLCLHDGTLIDQFKASSEIVDLVYFSSHNTRGYAEIITWICSARHYEFAIVTSMEGRGVLKPLRGQRVGSVSVIHEVGPPKSVLYEILAYSTETAFSSGLTLQSALEENYFVRTSSMHVLPQSRCLIQPVEPSAGSADLLSASAEMNQATGATTFQFAHYAQEVEGLGLRAAEMQVQIAQDRLDIEAAQTIRPDFFRHLEVPPIVCGETVALSYLYNAASGFHCRKPEPGFHPLLFAEFNEVGKADSYAAFSPRGRPSGPWLQKVIEGGAAEAKSYSAAELATAIHIHAYFTNLLPDIICRLHRNDALPDLHVTIASTSSVQDVARILSTYRGRISRIEVVPNIGRDIGPLLTSIGLELVNNYEVIGHIHIKGASSRVDSRAAGAWSEFLYENLLGGAHGGAMLDQILVHFAQDQRLGVVYPDDPNILDWMGNRTPAGVLARRLGHHILPRHFNFPVGTMFWMRAATLKRFVDLNLSWTDYPAEPVPYDGTMLHALERLFGVVPELDGWTSAVTNIVGLSR